MSVVENNITDRTTEFPKKYMHKLIIILVFMIPVLVSAQNGFQRVFLEVPSGIDAETCTRSIQLSNGNFASIGVNDGCVPCLPTFYFRISDPQGNEIRSSLYGAGFDFLYPDMVLSADGNIVCSVGSTERPSASPTDIEYHLNIIKLDTAGNSIINKNYVLKLINFISSTQVQLYSTSDTGYVITTNEHFVKLNTSLDTVVSFDSLSLSPSFKDINPDCFGFFSSDTISGNVRRFIKYYNSNFDSLNVGYLDSIAFEQIFKSGWSRSDVKKDYQGSIYFSLTNYNFDSTSVMKFDTSLHQLWNRYIVGDFAFGRQIALDSQNVLFTGIINHVIPSDYVGHNFLYRMNLNGDSLNYREFISDGIYTSSMIYDAKSYSGDYLLSGYAQNDTSVQKSFICRIDSALDIPLSIFNLDSKENFSIYPQPANLKVNITSPSTFICVYICDITGRIIKNFNNINSKSFEINTSEMLPGMYFVIGKNENSVVIKGRFQVVH